MKKLIVCLSIAVMMMGGMSAQAEELKSGPKLGAYVDAFDVKDCSGPAEGTTLCYRCRYGGRPTVTVFTRGINDELVSLIKAIDEKVAKNEDQKMAAFVVLLSDEQSSGSEQKLKELAEKHGIANTPLTVFGDSKGPAGYEISPDADVTVSMWTLGIAKANHAFPKGKLDKAGIEAVVKDTAKILE